MQHVPLHASVECTDGPAGKSTCVIVNRDSRQVTHFVVKEKQRPHAERLVPVDKALQTTADTITLDCTLAELAGLQPFKVDVYQPVEIPRYVGAGYLQTPYYTPSEQGYRKSKELVPEGDLVVRSGRRGACRRRQDRRGG